MLFIGLTGFWKQALSESEMVCLLLGAYIFRVDPSTRMYSTLNVYSYLADYVLSHIYERVSIMRGLAKGPNKTKEREVLKNTNPPLPRFIDWVLTLKRVMYFNHFVNVLLLFTFWETDYYQYHCSCCCCRHYHRHYSTLLARRNSIIIIIL